MGKLLSMEYDNLLNDIIKNEETEKYLALKYGVSKSYVSKVKRMIDGLQYSPIIKNGFIKCHLCDNQENLIIHRDTATGRYIAILCHTCKRKHKNFGLENNMDKEKECLLPFMWDLMNNKMSFKIQPTEEEKEKLKEVKQKLALMK